MELLTMKDIAEQQHVSYEAIRKQVVLYKKELEGHIIKDGRKQLFDEYAFNFLKTRRRQSPVILINQERTETIENLQREVETLKKQLMNAQNEILKSQEERLQSQKMIIELQEEQKKYIEDKAQFLNLERKSLEDQKQIETLKEELAQANKEKQSFKKTIFGLYRKTEE